PYVPLGLLAGPEDGQAGATLQLGSEEMKRDHGRQRSAKRGDHLGVEDALERSVGREEGDGSPGRASAAGEGDDLDAGGGGRVGRWHEERGVVHGGDLLAHRLVDWAWDVAGRVGRETAPEGLQQTVALLQRQVLQDGRHV
ncbi:hypothetical protein FQN49_008794, partial [Arthroderma sp. PD_2]